MKLMYEYVSSMSMMKMAKETGGVYCEIHKADEIPETISRYDFMRRIDNTDTDSDGIPDVLENMGIRVQNGTIIKGCDPLLADTDGDGISDEKEIGTVTYSEEKKYYCKMYSDPTKEDTDEDGLLDGTGIFINIKGRLVKIAPKDPDKTQYNGRKGSWKHHIKTMKDACENKNRGIKGRLAVECTNKFYEIPKFKMKEGHIKGLFRFKYPENISDVLKAFAPRIGSEALSFTYDEEGLALHSDRKQWQKYAGYNDFYDFVFGSVTDMEPLKLDFECGGKNYAVWAWKGNYLNLGAGAEVGFYTQNKYFKFLKDMTKLEHWQVEGTLEMTLSLYEIQSSDSYKAIYHWVPEEKQWWITGFVPKPNDYSTKADELLQIASVNFHENRDMFNEIRHKYELHQERNKIILDSEDDILWINF